MDNVIIRPVRRKDSDFLFSMINDPELVRWNAPFKNVSAEDHERWLSGILDHPSKKLFLIEQQGQPIGSVQLIDIDKTHNSAELTIRVKQDFQSKGAGTQAVTQLLGEARALGLHRVWLRVFSNNPRAIRAYEKAGFTHEGIMKEAALIEGKYLDVVIMGKLLDE